MIGQRDPFEATVEKFLALQGPAGMLIKGPWGSGKTYYWHHTIQQLRNEGGRIHPEGYAYISLFGLETLDDIRDAIFLSLASNGDSGSKLAKLSQYAPIVKELPGVEGWASLASAMSFSAVESCLVCVDDVERHSKGLCVSDILGLLDHLKYQKRCKIVLIGNVDSMTETDYLPAAEKLLDLEVQIERSPSDAWDLILGDSPSPPAALRESCATLQIGNMRTLERLRDILRIASNSLDLLPPERQDPAIRSLVLFTYLKQHASHELPSLEYLRTSTTVAPAPQLRERTDDEKRWDNFLRDYGYHHTDDLDQVLLDFVEKGWLDDDSMSAIAASAHEEAGKDRVRKEWWDIWALWHAGFDDNQTEIVTKLKQFVEKHHDAMSLADLNSAVQFLRRCDETRVADDLIDAYIGHHEGDERAFDSSTGPSSGWDPRLLREAKVARGQSKQLPTLKVVVRGLLSDRSGWSNLDEEVLAEASEDEYYSLFKKELGHDSVAGAKRCLDFGRLSNPTERHLKIAGNAEDALRRIAAESPINHLRVSELLDVDLGDTGNEEE